MQLDAKKTQQYFNVLQCVTNIMQLLVAEVLTGITPYSSSVNICIDIGAV